MQQFKNLIEFQEYFHSEEVCRNYLAGKRWKDGVITCPFCQSTSIYLFKDGRRYKCANKTCNKKFTVTVGTVYENSKIPLRKWFLAMYMITNHKKGISSCQLARDLGITQKSAWFVLHRIREMHREKSAKQLETVVQVDESYVGGKQKNKHVDKKTPNAQGRSTKDKTPILAAIDLNKKVRLKVIPNTKSETIKPIIEKWVKEGSIMVTDEWQAYTALQDKYLHVVIKHSDSEYVRGAFTTNNVENFWSQLKRGLYGVYHFCTAKHLQRYAEEFAFKYNSRKLKDVDRFEYATMQCEGRLKYQQLIAIKKMDSESISDTITTKS